MTKRSIKDFKPVGFKDGPFYNDEDVSKIIEAAGGLPTKKVRLLVPSPKKDTGEYMLVDSRRALWEKLENAARWWDVERQYQPSPTPLQLQKVYAQIQRQTAALLKTLYLDEVKEGQDILAALPESLKHGGFLIPAGREAEQKGGFPLFTNDGLIEDTIISIYRLQRWAKELEIRKVCEQKNYKEPKRAPDAALERLFQLLLGTWYDVFQKSPGTSVDGADGTATGPLIRFVMACLAPLQLDYLTAEAIRDRIRRKTGRRKSKSQQPPLDS
ncbi:MAG: hypothetical protein J0L97_06210 [Alphaproteobacteria bacterium]|nr:hypothetical protein [Alphaproteobacteria bacterium]